MTPFERRVDGTVPAIVLGVSLVVGLALMGHFIGKGAARFKSDTRTVTVKGLVEKELPADQAIWTLALRRTSDDLADAHAKISTDRNAVVAFLTQQGFKDAEFERQPTRSIDKLAREYGQSKDAERSRYVVTTAIVVKTADVDRIRTALGATDQLLAAGVLLDGTQEERANPRYVLAKFNDLRPQLLAEATRNARTLAEQFASDSGVAVGSIRSANQGMMQIFGTDGNDESGPYSPTSTPVKKIRVVSTFEFELR